MVRAIHEEVLLLALNDETGTINWRAEQYKYVLAGAVLAELMLRSAIRLEPDSKLVTLVSNEPTGHPALDHTLQALGTASRRKKLKRWVNVIAGERSLMSRCAARMVHDGVLSEKEGRFLFIFKRTEYPQRDPRVEKALIQRVRTALFDEHKPVDERTATLIALANPTGMLNIVFKGRELRQVKKRIRHLVNDNAIGKATSAVIEEIQAAIVAAITVSVVVGT